jgi:DNA-binding NtrC family response regulator
MTTNSAGSPVSKDVKSVGSGFLVVSDSPERGTLERSLSDVGLFSGACTSGKQAIDMLQRMPFRGILCDLRRSRTEASDLLAKVRTTYPHIAFVMITGPKGVREGILSLMAGASAFLVKPLSRDAILTSANQALEKKRLYLHIEKFRVVTRRF